MLRLPPEQFRKNIVRTGKIRKSRRILVRVACVSLRCVILVIWLAGPFGAKSINLSLIKFFALGLVRKNVVGQGNFLETFLCLLVARIEVRMQLLRQAAIGFLDIIDEAVRATPRIS